MKQRKDELELIRGSGNVFEDLGRPNAQREQIRALLAAEIIGILQRRKLTYAAAEQVTGVPANEFSRIGRVKLERFTVDRLITILERLGQRVEVTVKVPPRRSRQTAAEPVTA